MTSDCKPQPEERERVPLRQNHSFGNGTWSELFSPQYRAAAIVLSSGVAMYAINVYVTASMLPIMISDIGGGSLYGWVTTMFLIASIVATSLGPHTIRSFGVPRAYLFAFCMFALGATLCAFAPTMETLLAGRMVQGFGGGLLSSFGFIVIRIVFPDKLWTKATGLSSAMWGIGNLLGPVIGGIFAQFQQWRIAFMCIGGLALLLGLFAFRTFPKKMQKLSRKSRVPYLSIIALTLAVASFSSSAVLPIGWGTSLGFGLGLIMFVLFVTFERTLSATVLPHLTYRAGNPLKWVYLALGFAAGCAIIEAFVPLFGQQLGGLEPLYAGLLGGVISLGWSTAQVLSVSINHKRLIAIVSGPAIILVGMASFAFTLTDNASQSRVWVWAGLLFIAGSGIGLAFPHLSVAAMRSTRDPIEGAKAAAGVSAVQLTSSAVASAWIGSLVSIGGPTALGSAQAMSVGLITMAGISLVCAIFVGANKLLRIYVQSTRN